MINDSYTNQILSSTMFMSDAKDNMNGLDKINESDDSYSRIQYTDMTARKTDPMRGTVTSEMNKTGNKFTNEISAESNDSKNATFH